MSTIESLASKFLGVSSAYSNGYDSGNLVAIPRQLNRDSLNINQAKLPFCGYDVWHAYEASFLTNNGLPVNGMLKLSFPADSVFHVESKSLKLYLNGFNMLKIGENTEDAISCFKKTVKDDLSAKLECKVVVDFFTDNSSSTNSFSEYSNISTFVDLDNIDFSAKIDSKNCFSGDKLNKIKNYKFSTDLLRSNCRVTNQPDWANVYIQLNTLTDINFMEFAQYIIKMRQDNHFHEEVCEKIFIDIMSKIKPIDLMVCCLYTRRGGIDINPVRATSINFIPKSFCREGIFEQKTLRQ